MKKSITITIIIVLILMVIYMGNIIIYQKKTSGPQNIDDDKTATTENNSVVTTTEDTNFSINETSTETINFSTNSSYKEVEMSQSDNDDAIINDAIEKAEEALQQYNYDAALTYVANAYQTVSDTSRLIQENERINNMRPVNLLDYEMLSGEPTIWGSEEINTGQTVQGIGVTMDADMEAGDTLRNTISYATNGEYGTFKCNLALLNDLSKNNPLEITLEVYCDSILTYTSPVLLKGSMPIEINTDISNAQKVDIKFTVHNQNDYSWLPSMWSEDRYYAVNFMIYDAEFLPKYTPLQ